MYQFSLSYCTNEYTDKFLGLIGSLKHLQGVSSFSKFTPAPYVGVARLSLTTDIDLLIQKVNLTTESPAEGLTKCQTMMIHNYISISISHHSNSLTFNNKVISLHYVLTVVLL